jgi:magnesium-transporting ATPase (P-type)
MAAFRTYIRNKSARIRSASGSWIFIGLLVGIFLAGLKLFRWRKRRFAGLRKPSQGEQASGLGISVFDPQLKGLSEEQVAERSKNVDLEALAREEDKAFRRKAFRQILLSTFNINLFAIAIVMLLLSSPWNALITLIMLAISVILRIGQVTVTKNKLNQILKDIQPQSAVIREGIIRNIDPAQVVQGDLLLVRQGDQILLDGELIGDSELIVEESVPGNGEHRSLKHSGDTVQAGSFCVKGHAVYRARVSDIRQPTSEKLELLLGEMTPLELMMSTIFRILLGLAVLLTVFLVIDTIMTDVVFLSPEFRTAFSIIHSIAPTSLFLILIIQYAMGMFRLSQQGALVYKSESIERLANVSILSLSKSSLISGVNVDVDILDPPAGFEPLDENTIRHILGDITNSIPVSTNAGYRLAEAFPGTPRKSVETAPHYSTVGWFGVVFNEPVLRGTYILGDPSMLEPHLAKGTPQVFREMKDSITQTQRGFNHWLERFKHQDRGRENQAKPTAQLESVQQDSQTSKVITDVGELPPNPSEQQLPTSFQQRFLKALQSLRMPPEDRYAHKDNFEESPDQLVLLCVYLPEPVSLYNRQGQPQLPAALIPMARLSVSDVVRPESKRVIQNLSESDVKIKILAADSPQRTVSIAKELGLADELLSWASRAEMGTQDPAEFSRIVTENTIFGNLSPSGGARIIQELKDQGEYIAIVGNDTSDVPAMRQADLRMVIKSGTQAAIMLSDIILLEETLKSLPSVLSTGQRLVNGVLDTFKLWLSHVISILLMILVTLLLRMRLFPYQPVHGSLIAVFTITFPIIVMSAWSSAGRLTEFEMRRKLANFIIPTAITMTILAFAVYYVFLNRTPTPGFNAWVTEKLNYANVQRFYAELGVTYALLIAGWLRLFFLQPPSRLWIGAAPLRGDKRLYSLVAIMIALFVLVLSVPIFQVWFKVTWLPYWTDYLIVALFAAIWALLLSVIWRLRLIESIVNIFARDTR